MRVIPIDTVEGRKGIGGLGDPEPNTGKDRPDDLPIRRIIVDDQDQPALSTVGESSAFPDDRRPGKKGSRQRSFHSDDDLPHRAAPLQQGVGGGELGEGKCRTHHRLELTTGDQFFQPREPLPAARRQAVARARG